MKKLILGLLFISSFAFARFPYQVYQMPAPGSNSPGWASVGSNSIINNINLPGNTVQENGRNVIVSQTNATTSLGIIRGLLPAAGTTPTSGEGFSYTHTGSSAVYVVSFTISFSDTPACLCNPAPAGVSALLCNTCGISAGGVSFCTFNAAAQQTDIPFSFVCIGQR